MESCLHPFCGASWLLGFRLQALGTTPSTRTSTALGRKRGCRETPNFRRSGAGSHESRVRSMASISAGVGMLEAADASRGAVSIKNRPLGESKWQHILSKGASPVLSPNGHIRIVLSLPLVTSVLASGEKRTLATPEPQVEGPERTCATG